MGRQVVFAFLGTNNYVPVRYAMGDYRTAERETFVQAALVDCLGAKLDRHPEQAFIAVTAAARDKHWSALKVRLEALGVTASPLDIKDGASEEELWEVFGKIGSVFKADDHVVFDMTHGYRSLAGAGLLAMGFFRHTLGLRVDVFYGAFETLGTVSDLRQREGDEPGWFDEHCAPFFDLTPMFALPSWAEAVAEWKRTGRADGIVDRTRPYTDALRRELKGKAPRALTSLPKDLHLLGQALTLLRQDKVGPLAGVVVARASEAVEEVGAEPRLAPLGHLLEAIRSSASALWGPGDAWAEYGNEYLRHQVEIARWMAKHGRIVEGFSFAREIVSSCAVRMVLASGVETIDGKDSKSKEYRASADGICAKLSGAGRDRSLRETEREAAERVEPWLGERSLLAEAFRAAYQATQQHRNKLDHCWMGDEHARQNFNEATAARFANDLIEAVADAGKLVEGVAADGWTAAPRLANLSNHPVSTWSDAQVRAARELGFGEPEELKGGMPLVPAEATTEEIESLASELANRAVAQGARGAYVAGEFTLTYALVRALRARGVRSFSATTGREAHETVQEDGSVARSSRFQFVSWREYPTG